MCVNDIVAVRAAVDNADEALNDEEIMKQFLLGTLKTAKEMRAWVGEVNIACEIFDLPAKGDKNAIAGSIARTIKEVKES